MVILKNNNGLIGRALLWVDVETREGEKITVLDRIYGNSDTIEKFKKFAQKKGFYCKHRQNYNSPKELEFNGEYVEKEFDIYLETNFDYYPYTDTMYYLHDDRLSNWDHHGSRLDCTDGYSNDDRVYCEHCENYYNEDEMYYIDGYHCCESCTNDNFTYIDNRDEYVNNDYVQYCHKCDMYHHEDDILNFNNGDICKDCFNDEYVEINDNYVHIDNAFSCDDCGEYYHIDDLYHDEIDNLNLCESCYNDLMEERKEEEEKKGNE